MDSRYENREMQMDPAEADEVIMNSRVIDLARKKQLNFSISCNFSANSKYSLVKGGVAFA